LQDPLGIALDNGVAVLQSYDKLTALMKTISEKPFYESAVLAYRLFFDPKTTYEKQEYRPMDCHAESAIKSFFGKCADSTDEDKLKELLEVDNRQKLRVKIRELKKAQIDFLLSTELDRPVYEEDRGCRYLETLLEPNHPLHALLFPTEQQAPVESDGPVQETDPQK
jgi:hypothetical protein